MSDDLLDRDFEEIRARSLHWAELVRAVISEVSECNGYLQKSQSPFWRRTAYRSIFSSIEALTYNLKQYTLLHLVGDKSFFPEAHRLALQDLAVGINEAGEVQSKALKIPTAANILLAFKSFSAIYGQTYSLPRPCADWDALRRAIKVRDRVTHPKSAADYQISDEEFKDANCAWDWFAHTLTQVTQPARDAAEYAVKKGK